MHANRVVDSSLRHYPCPIFGKGYEELVTPSLQKKGDWKMNDFQSLPNVLFGALTERTAVTTEPKAPAHRKGYDAFPTW
jgi:hypothetical protein